MPYTFEGRWSDTARAVLQEKLARSYSTPPIGVLDWDETCIRGDIGNAAFHVLAERLDFDWASSFVWDWVDETQQGDWVREAYADYAREQSPENAYRLRHSLEYARTEMWRELDDIQCCAWDSAAFFGKTCAEVCALARQVIANETARPLAAETLAVPGRPSVEIERGMRRRQEILDLVRAMQGAGWDVWVISGTLRWLVQVFAAEYGIPADHVLGMQRTLDRAGRISTEIVAPITCDAGKIAAYEQCIRRGQPPLLVASDSDSDWMLLDYSSGVRLLTRPLKERLVRYAQWRASLAEPWLIEPFPEIEDSL